MEYVFQYTLYFREQLVLSCIFYISGVFSPIAVKIRSSTQFKCPEFFLTPKPLWT